MTRSRIILSLSIAAFVTACSTTESTSPAAKTARPTVSFDGSNNSDGNGKSGSAGAPDADYHDGLVVPGSVGKAGSAPATGEQKRLACNIPAPISGSATIGPEGGQLHVGANLLIVPPGALTQRVTLSGTVAAGTEFLIDFQPHGLQFHKPAGLILDLTACGSAPNVVYLDEQGGILERITAVFSTWWHTVAAPLDHFSTYFVDV